MAHKRDDDGLKGALGEPSAPSGERGVPRRAGDSPGEDDPAAEARRQEHEILNDPSRIAIGNRQLNAAAFSANRPDPQAQNQQAHERRRKDDEAYSRELQRYAAWSAQTVTIGGVQMTNGEAQRARRHCIENEDAVAERAVRKGHIRADQKERFKHEMRREYELADREGRGVSTAEDRDEQERLKKSTLAAPRGRAIADAFQEEQRLTAERQHSMGSSNAPSASADASANDLFRSAPDLQGRFATAHAGPRPENEQAPVPVPAPDAPVKARPAATGLDI